MNGLSDSSLHGVRCPKQERNKNQAYVRYPADLIAVDPHYAERMVTVLYRCPNTGFRVQGYTLDETIPSNHDSYGASDLSRVQTTPLCEPQDRRTP
jgi:hypothetical protein